MTDTQYQLSNPPQDGITNITFSPDDSKNLLVSSWDKTLRLYNTNTRQLSLKIQTESPLLDCCFGPNTAAFSGGLDRKVNMYDLTTQTKTTIGEHANGVRCVCWSSETNSVYSASWDSTLKVWDPRSSTLQHNVDLPHKAFSMDLLNNTLALAMAEKCIHIYDIRNMSQPSQIRNTTLKYMLKCIRLMPQAEGFACSSIEGRVALEFFDPASQDKKYAFKLHRQTMNDTEVVYPVNTLAFHPKYGTFASGGSDCIVNIWDGVHRKRVKQFTGYPDEIASIAFSHDGSVMAVASSYTFDEGERDHAPETIFVRQLQDSEVRPRKIQ
ncbi:WD40-repeat-containing domain protein [Sporodiniella umbellata]|nr:WD40-repeat-containing domain protein [Sporodiniella umbellata]